MPRRIVIEPVTRVEGHARVTIELGDDGRVTGAHVHLLELRGFEALCAGRLVQELPAITARICGICPVSHALAAAKAGDVVLGASPPPAARKLRELLQLAEVAQSHALSFFYLSAPDLVVGPEADVARRTLPGAADEAPEVMRDGLLLRRFGREVIEQVTGRRVHPAFAVPGGVARPLHPEVRDALAAAAVPALAAARRALAWWEELAPRREVELSGCGGLESLFVALAGPAGGPAYSEGLLRVISATGDVIAEGLDPARYAEFIAEALEPRTYARLPYWSASGYPAGMYRVGPLARLNVVTRFGTPLAEQARQRFRASSRAPVRSAFAAHQARLVEILHAIERIQELLCDPELVERDVLSPAGPRCREGVGACEAPRGTLFHHYRVDPDGLVTWANLIVASGQNGLAMDATVRQLAERWLTGARITPPLLQRVEAGIRAHDPCLSCATHAVGGRSIALRLVGPRGEVVDEWPREETRAAGQ